MRLIETPIPSAWIVEPEPIADERGFFARTFDRDAFAARALETDWPQWSISFSPRAGTLRGMHFQRPPHEETKLVRCTRGAIHDVIIDLRPWSPRFGSHFAIVLSADNRKGLYVPRGLAHGFQTLHDNCEVFYQITPAYVPAAAAGVRFDDPAFEIEWPRPVSVISDRDRSVPDFHHEPHVAGCAHHR